MLIDPIIVRGRARRLHRRASERRERNKCQTSQLDGGNSAWGSRPLEFSVLEKLEVNIRKVIEILTRK